MNKTIRNLLLALVVIAAIVAVVVVTRKPSSIGSSIKIGAILPLTGDAAEYGRNDRDGITLAVNQANAAGGIRGQKIQVDFEDCQTDAKRAIAAFGKLRSAGVDVLIDDAISTVSLATVPLLAENKTVLISTGASNPSLSGASPYFFRIWNSDAYEGEVAADYLKRQSPAAKKVVILYDNNDYGKGLHDVLAKELAASDVRIVGSESFETDARDFRSQVAKIKAAAPDYVYLVGYAAQTGPATRQLREGGVRAVIVGTVAMQDPEYVKLASDAAEGAVYPFPAPPSGSAVSEFQSAFRKAYGKDPGLLDDCGFDAANLIIDAFRHGATTGEQVREQLTKVREFHGASGVISFDAKGDVRKPMIMKSIKNGQFVPLS
jgi:branched-chain amino acid transport system substrate-binding protein